MRSFYNITVFIRNHSINKNIYINYYLQNIMLNFSLYFKSISESFVLQHYKFL